MLAEQQLIACPGCKCAVSDFVGEGSKYFICTECFTVAAFSEFTLVKITYNEILKAAKQFKFNASLLVLGLDKARTELLEKRYVN